MRQFVILEVGIELEAGGSKQKLFIAMEGPRPMKVDGKHILAVDKASYDELETKYIRLQKYGNTGGKDANS